MVQVHNTIAEVSREHHQSSHRRLEVCEQPISGPSALAWYFPPCSIPSLWVATGTTATTLHPRRPLDQRAKPFLHILYWALLLPLLNPAFMLADLMTSVNPLAPPPCPTNLDSDMVEVPVRKAMHPASCPAPQQIPSIRLIPPLL